MFYLVLSVMRSEIKIFRLLFSACIITLYALIRQRLNNPTILLDMIVHVIALLVIKRDYYFLEFCKTGLIYVCVLLVTEAFKTLLHDSLLPNDLLADLLVAISVLITSFIFTVALKLGGRKRGSKLIFDVEISNNGKVSKAKAYWDSGNSIYDKGVPVIVVSNKIAKKIALDGKRNLLISTVSGTIELPVTDVELKIYYDKKTHKLYHTKAIVSDKIDLRGYDVLLHKEMEVA